MEYWQIILIGAAVVAVAIPALVMILRLEKKVIKGEDQTSKSFAQLLKLVQRPVRRASPVTELTFEQSLSPSLFIEATEKALMINLTSNFAVCFADLGSIKIQSVQMVKGQPTVVFTLSKKGQKLIRDGKAIFPIHRKSGRILPFIKDAKTGRMIEQLKGVPVTRVTSRLANLSSAVIGTAHIISGHDIVKRLRNVQKQVEFLVAARAIDQRAKLESIYSFSREILSRPIGPQDQNQLWLMRRDLMELRSAWRRELKYNLSNIEDLNAASWVKRFFSRKKTQDKKVYEAISRGEIEIGLIEYSLRLDLALAESSGTLRAFLTHTLPAELDSLRNVCDFIKSKAGLISGKYPELTADYVVHDLSDVAEAYAKLSIRKSPRTIEQSNSNMLPPNVKQKDSDTEKVSSK